MHTQAYIAARKEFINCIVLSPICIFVSLIIAFTEWLPIMHAEKNKVEAQPIHTTHFSDRSSRKRRRSTGGCAAFCVLPKAYELLSSEGKCFMKQKSPPKDGDLYFSVGHSALGMWLSR